MERVGDPKYIELLRKLLRAGYYDSKGTFHNASSIGTPQGSVISPILSNIVLDLVDKFLDSYKTNFDSGKVRKINPLYKKISRQIEKTRLASERLALQKKRNLLRAHIDDPDFRRFKYVRYADDILMGVIGNKSDCVKIRKDLQDFLSTLGLSLNQEKTLITHASSGKPAQFLGYDIHITPVNKRPVVKKTFGTRTISSSNITRPIINVPIREIVNKLGEKGYCLHGGRGIPTRCGRLVNEEHRTIVQVYLRIGYGLLNYYKIATNFNRFKFRLFYILYYSCALTLASKFRLGTKRKTFKKFGKNLATFKKINDRLLVDVEFNKHSFDRIQHVKDHASFSGKTRLLNPMDFLDSLTYQLPRAKAALGRPCIICNSTEDIEMHHIKHLKKSNLQDRDYLTGRMIKMKRKQVPICKSCHIKLHAGKYNGPGL